jgi:ribosomal protein L29
MKISEIRDLSISQITEKLKELYKKEVSLKLNIGQENFTQTHKLSAVKKTIARLLTIRSEKNAEVI